MPGIQPKVQVVLRQGHKQFKGKALVNTGSQITYIMPEIVEQAGFRTFKIEHPYRVRNADGSYNTTEWKEGVQVLLEAQGVKEYHNVAIIKSTGQQMILGMDWMGKHGTCIVLGKTNTSIMTPEVMVAKVATGKSKTPQYRQ